VPNLNLIEAGVVVAAAEVELPAVFVVELTRELRVPGPSSRVGNREMRMATYDQGNLGAAESGDLGGRRTTMGTDASVEELRCGDRSVGPDVGGRCGAA
jgi:hypothetical protein